MKVNKAIIVPFNNWWRTYGGHTQEPNLMAIEAFEAGYKAGVEQCKAIISGTHPSQQANPLAHSTYPKEPT